MTGEGEYEDWQAQGRRVGWIDDDGSLLLEPGAAFATAQRIAREQGTSLPIKERTLWKRMLEKGLLASRDSARGRNTSRATIARERRTVVHLIPGALSPEDGPNGPIGPSNGDKGASGPKRGAVPSPARPETARENGPDASANDSSGPKGTIGPVTEDEGLENANIGTSHLWPARLSEGEAHFIDTEAGLKDLIPELQKADLVALDLETTGLDPRQHRTRLLTLATERGAWVVDCFGVDPSPLFPVLTEKRLAIHNASFDLGFLFQMGFEPGEGFEVLDTMVMSQLIGHDPERKEDR